MVDIWEKLNMEPAEDMAEIQDTWIQIIALNDAGGWKIML